MNPQTLNPLEFPAWDSFLLRTRDPSFFHSSIWAKILHESYRYKPLYLACIDKERLDLSMPLMEVPGLFAGKRGVSLPFTDHCAPFFREKKALDEAVHFAIDYGTSARWRYIEWRDAECFDADVPPSEAFYGHELDLQKSDEDLLRLLRENNRRNIKRAMREGVTIEFSQSSDSLRAFYRLNCQTRKRHGLPPQPFAFFSNILEHAISKGHGFIVSAYQARRLLASAIFFHFGSQAIYKYGASDPATHLLRPNNLILWEAMKRYRDLNLRTLSLGRTELDNHGLLRYKRSWGARERILKYYRYDLHRRAFLTRGPISRRRGFQTKVFSRLPDRILQAIGNLAYRYVG